jgi:hypothetical protein
MASTHPQIPLPVIGVAAEILADLHTHATMDTAFYAAGAPDPIPQGNKIAKARAWLSQANLAPSTRPLDVLGLLLSELFEVDAPSGWEEGAEKRQQQRVRMQATLEKSGHRYEPGGRVVAIGSTLVARSLDELLAARDWEAVHAEFERAMSTIERSPADAVSVTCLGSSDQKLLGNSLFGSV